MFSDWRVYDRELCERVASSGELQVSLKSLLSEEFLSDMEDYLRQILAGQSPQVLVRREIFSTIRSLAMTGKAVILGRGGACLTSSLGKGVHIRLVASRESRIQRLRDRFSLSESEALEQADKQDAHREKLVRVCFGKDIENPLLYDAVYNTDTVPFAVIASAVMGMVKERELQPVY